MRPPKSLLSNYANGSLDQTKTSGSVLSCLHYLPGERAEKAQYWIRFFHALTEAIDRGEKLLLVFGGGLTYRDGALIRFIRRQEQEEAALADIYREFGALLPAEALRESLEKLERLGYLEMEDGWVGLTFRGRYVYL